MSRGNDERNREKICQSCPVATPTGTSDEQKCQLCRVAPPTGIFNEPRCQSCSFAPPTAAHVPAQGWCANGRNSLSVLINTKPEHFERRQILRNTWMKTITSGQHRLQLGYVFLLGRSLDHTTDMKVTIEQSSHRDMLVSEFHDQYDNLNIKTLTGFKLVAESCKGVSYILKTDDDMFINPFALQTLISSTGFNASGTILGNCFGSGYPHRSPTSKWYASYESFPHQYYPGFCLGAAMLMEIATAVRLLEAAGRKPLFHIEDVYISGLLGNAASVRVKQAAGFALHKVQLDETCPWASATYASLLERNEDFLVLYKQLMNHSCLQ